MGGGLGPALGSLGGGAAGLALAPATGGLSAALPFIAAGTGLGAAAATGATGGNIQQALINGALAGGTAYAGGSLLGGLPGASDISGLGGSDALSGAISGAPVAAPAAGVGTGLIGPAAGTGLTAAGAPISAPGLGPSSGLLGTSTLGMLPGEAASLAAGANELQQLTNLGAPQSSLGILSGLSGSEKLGVGLIGANLAAGLSQGNPPIAAPGVPLGSNTPGGGGSFTPSVQAILQQRLRQRFA